MPRIQISEPGKTPQPYKVKLDRETIKIGRSSGNDLYLTDPSTSSNHCVIHRVEGGYVLEDNKSTNGVKLDEQRFLKIDLNQDTDFQLGDVDVQFTLSDEEYDILAEEGDFESQQKPMLPPTKKERDEKRAKREKAKQAQDKNDDDIAEIEDDEEESPKRKSSNSGRKHSSSRASLMLDIEEDEEEDSLDDDDIELNDEDDEEEEKPRARRKPSGSRPPRRAQRLAQKNKTNPLVAFLFLFLCLVGFVGGICLKHYQEHGTFLLQDIFGEKPPLPVEKPNKE